MHPEPNTEQKAILQADCVRVAPRPEYVWVAVPATTRHALTYKVPAGANVQTGSIVQVGIKGRKKVGVVMGSTSEPEFACKEIGGGIFGQPALPPRLLALLEWVASYYLCPVPRLIQLVAPGQIWKESADAKRAARLGGSPAEGGISLLPFLLHGEPLHRKPRSVYPREALNILGHEQAAACAFIRQSQHLLAESPEHMRGAAHPAQKKWHAILLEGVTGSGKTEVYLWLVHDCLEQGKTALVLVPEIALTPQMTRRFRAIFGEDLAVLHSGLTTAETEREWYRIVFNQARVVLGVRRGVFAPLANIGLIVVDEEHDASYKSDDFPCIHARDVAVKRAAIEGAICLLGSATPSIETYANVQNGRYGHVKLTSRQNGQRPQIEIFDARPFFKDLHKKNPRAKRNTEIARSTELSFERSVILPRIVTELKACFERREQSMVIVNRRGFANFSLCLDCGTAATCPHCAVTTTLHRQAKIEICHHCGFKTARRTQCTNCNSSRLEYRGFGTQMIEDELAALLPELKIERLDRDMMTSPTRLSASLDRFRSGQADTLIGTQILSKGHDFPRVSLVAVLHLEDALFLPDFRSAERTFQLLLQSAGRAGRGDLPGRVVVQSLQVEHPVLKAVSSDLAANFYAQELALRKLALLPPFTRQILIELEHKNEDHLSAAAFGAKKLLEQQLAWAEQHFAKFHAAANLKKVRLIGPHPAPVEKLRGLWRCQICLCSPKEIAPRHLVPDALQSDVFDGCRLRVDVDPYKFI